jgi:hypothetical protein
MGEYTRRLLAKQASQRLERFGYEPGKSARAGDVVASAAPTRMDTDTVRRLRNARKQERAL